MESTTFLTALSLPSTASVGETTRSGSAQWARLRTDWLTEVFARQHPDLPCANTYTWLSN